jgi:hypothetical protein
LDNVSLRPRLNAFNVKSVAARVSMVGEKSLITLIDRSAAPFGEAGNHSVIFGAETLWWLTAAMFALLGGGGWSGLGRCDEHLLGPFAMWGKLG